MGRVELFYFVSTFFTIVLLSLFYSFAIFEVPPVDLIFNFQASPCDEKNTKNAVPVGNYVYVYNETAPEKHFTKGNVSYGCPCSANPCISKCCPFGQEKFTECDTLNETEYPNYTSEQERLFYNLKYNTSLQDTTPKTNPNQFNIVFNFLSSPQSETVVRMDQGEYFLFENGTVKLNHQCNIIEHDTCYLDYSNYCLDSLDGSSVSLYYRESAAKNAETKKNLDRIIYGCASIISGVSVILTLVIYAALPSLRNLSGKCLMCYFLCMSMVFIWCACQYLIPIDVSKEVCAFVGKF